MAKLNQLILLENMMKTYDAMNLKDANLTHFQGVCTEKLVDNINGRLERLVVSKVRMSCRNVLLANYETMTKTTYWLGCRLFSDLPQGESRVQREKVEQMVELLNELVLKIVNEDEEYAKRFFERIKMAYHQKSRTDFELWIARQSHLTIERLKEYQAELTADMLIMGILKYDDMPSGKELKEVDMEKLREHLRKDKELPEDFGLECAKLRRYSHWEGDMFFIDYEKLRKPLFQHFGELTHEQHIAMFEYDVQMKQIHEEMKRLVGAEAPKCTGGQCALETDEELFKFIHPSISGEEEWQIHEEVKRLVTHHGVQEIGQYLYQMAREKKILLPQMPSVAYAELVRMGMPSSEGFNKKTFLKYYLRG